MQTRDAFQFNASPRTPAVLHRTLIEVIEFCNGRFRPYYAQVVERILAHVRTHHFDTVVELGAGSAPLTRRLVEHPDARDLRFVVCDLIPDADLYHELETRHPGRITGLTEPVDFGQPRDWGPRTLLVLCATFHHVPRRVRPQVLAALVESAGGAMFFAPVRKTWRSLAGALLVLVPALLLPVVYLGRPGRLRRLFWCWVLPIVPMMMLWDGVGGCLRQWDADDWQREFDTLNRPVTIEESSDAQVVIA
jgi:hypothetical protein